MNKTLVMDCRASETAINKLQSLGYDIIKIPSNPWFAGPISAHPDIFMSKICDTFFVDACVHESFIKFGDFVVCNREAAYDRIIKYPDDISFNCVNVGSRLICNKAHTHINIIEFAEKNRIEIIDVKQGYAKCSTCVVSDNAIITEDASIAQSAEIAGIDVLKIEKGHVALDGYDYGFIGGCSGLIEKDLLAFNGDITKHPDYKRIAEFCSKYDVSILGLSDEKLYDIGSIIKICF